MKRRRLGFGYKFVHLMASKDVDSHQKPNAVASVFMTNIDIPADKKHVIQLGNDHNEDSALDALQSIIEENVVGRTADSVYNY